MQRLTASPLVGSAAATATASTPGVVSWLELAKPYARAVARMGAMFAATPGWVA